MWLLWVVPALALLVALGLWFFKIAFALPPPKELQRTPPGGPPRSVPDPRGPGERAAK